MIFTDQLIGQTKNVKEAKKHRQRNQHVDIGNNLRNIIVLMQLHVLNT